MQQWKGKKMFWFILVLANLGAAIANIAIYAHTGSDVNLVCGVIHSMVTLSLLIDKAVDG